MQNVTRTIRGDKNYPPASEPDVREAERNLGFPFPPLLREHYLTVGNGGYGPDRAAMLGVRGGYSYHGTCVDALYKIIRDPEYAGLSGRTQRFLYKQQVTTGWPEYLLYLYLFMAPIYLCLDCSCEDGGVYYFDAAEVMEDNPDDNVVEINLISPSFSEFLSAHKEEGALDSKVERIFAAKRAEPARNNGVSSPSLTVAQATDSQRKH